MSKLAEVEAKRAARKAELQAQEDEQRATDLEALDELEVLHGDSNVCHVSVPFSPGLPTLAAARMPSPVELKRYRQTLKVKGQEVDIQAANDAAAQLGAVVCIYPEKDVFAKMCEARPDLRSQLGSRATKLAQGKAADEGKE